MSLPQRGNRTLSHAVYNRQYKFYTFQFALHSMRLLRTSQ